RARRGAARVGAVGRVVGADVPAERVRRQERRRTRAGRGDSDVIDVDVAAVAALAVHGDGVGTRGQGDRYGDGRPGVPTRRRRKGDLGGGAVDDQALGARFGVAVATGGVGVTDGHV